MALQVLLLAVLCFVAKIEAFSKEELDLRNAILKGSKLILTKNVVLTADLPLISARKTVTIQGSRLGTGKPITIDGRGLYSMFKSSGKGAVTLSLNNLIITRAKPAAVNPLAGAAVDIGDPGSVLKVDKVSFNYNAPAIYFSGLTATISRTKFIGQSTTAVILDQKSFTQFGPPNVNLAGCTFTNNKADYGGGAIRLIQTGDEEGPTLVASKTTFESNTAQGAYGGAVDLRGYNKGTFIDCTFKGNTASQGGAIATNDDASFSAEGCTFVGNKADIGGAVYMTSGNENYGFSRIVRSSFSGNSASTAGGAYSISSFNGVDLCSSTFTSNTADGAPNDAYDAFNEVTIIPDTKCP